MRTVKRIIKILDIDNYIITCLFNNGESRIINFKDLFNKWNINKGDIEYLISSSINEFLKVKVVDGSLTWDNIMLKSSDEYGKEVMYSYQLDPIVIYENSRLDETRQIEIGLLIKKTRNELGLTQEELARKSGTTKHYISRIENNRTGIELATLKRIIEGGLGRRMEISII